MELGKIKSDFDECRLPLHFLDRNPRTRRWSRRERRWIVEADGGFYLDVQKNRKGEEEFHVFIGKDSDVTVLDKVPSERHVLILVKTEENKERYILGHDERQLFVAPLGTSRASTLKEAFKQLKPLEVAQAESRKLKVQRQGEWFFVPEPGFTPSRGCQIDRKVDIQGGRRRSGNPHIADELIRMRAKPEDYPIEEIIYVRGKVRHGEHSTVEFDEWHRVYRNLEIESSQSVAYVVHAEKRPFGSSDVFAVARVL